MAYQVQSMCRLGIVELYLHNCYGCILTNIEEKILLDLLLSRRQKHGASYQAAMQCCHNNRITKWQNREERG